jgi:sugar phosphate isomerase/epimerase
VGEGVVDFPAIFKILKEAGFDGWISMEVGGTGSRQSIADSLAYVKEKWSEA